jgi:pimeloyl-ACP methyl ester carboxylesterase
MTDSFGRLATKVPGLHRHIPPDVAGTTRPLVVLLHGLGGNRDDWISPLQDRNMPYDHRQNPPPIPLGEQESQPQAAVLGLLPSNYASPRLTANSNGVEGSDDRSWWHALAQAGFPLLTYGQVSGFLLPFGLGPVAEFRAFMESLQDDLQDDPAFAQRPVVIVGHSRGGLIARAYLGDPEVKADTTSRFPRVAGLITLSTPHAGSKMALLDDPIVTFISALRRVLSALPFDSADRILDSIQEIIVSIMGRETDEIAPGSQLFQTLESQEPIHPGVRCLSMGGTSPRFVRVYARLLDLVGPLRSRATGEIGFRWQAKAKEIKGAAILDGRLFKWVGVDLDEMTDGRGDGLTADVSCHFPASFHEEGHLSLPLNHGEELWDRGLQEAIIQRLQTF